MAKVAIQGALNVDNFGDVLLGRIYSDWIAQQNHEVYIPKAKESVLEELPNAKRGKFLDTDALVYVGGGYFGEPPRRFLGKYRWGFRMMRYHLSPSLFFLAKPIAIIGVGVGPVTNILAWIGVLLVSYKSKKMVVRDNIGANYLKKKGLYKNVMVAPDAALTLQRSSYSPEKSGTSSKLKALSNNLPIIAIHYDKQAAKDEEWSFLYEKTLAWLQSQKVHTLLLTDQKNTPVVKEQLESYSQFTENLKNVSVYEYKEVDNLIETLSCCDVILTTKLHVAIVGTALEIPTYSLPCHTKTERFFNQIELPEVCLPMGNWTSENLERFFDRVDKRELPNKDILLKQKESAQKGLDELKGFLNSL